jgi:hypothetical protein
MAPLTGWTKDFRMPNKHAVDQKYTKGYSLEVVSMQKEHRF